MPPSQTPPLLKTPKKTLKRGLLLIRQISDEFDDDQVDERPGPGAGIVPLSPVKHQLKADHPVQSLSKEETDSEQVAPLQRATVKVIKSAGLRPERYVTPDILGPVFEREAEYHTYDGT